MAMSTEGLAEGYGDSTWNYKTVLVHEEQITRTLAQEGADGWDCLGITVRLSSADEYVIVLRSKKSMAGV